MADLTTRELLELLAGLESRSRQHASGLPQQEEIKQAWDGIAFQLGELHIVAPLDEVIEILNYPQLTRVPGAKPWVKGVANVRGNLLPVMDLRGFLGQSPTRLHHRSRVLVISHQGVVAGLLVDAILGHKQFFEEERDNSIAVPVASMAPFLAEGYRQDGSEWIVFSMRKLAESPDFMQVAA